MNRLTGSPPPANPPRAGRLAFEAYRSRAGGRAAANWSNWGAAETGVGKNVRKPALKKTVFRGGS